MSTTHTPGPWATSKKCIRRVTNTKGIVVCTAVLRNRGTAEKGINQGSKRAQEAEANARLIAAAPDLLASLQSLVNCISETRGIDATNALESAREAIRKATTP